MISPVRKAVLPVAGLGTRFLPATKAIPKEMLPVVDRPLIQIVVDEAREAGIEQFIFVTGRNKAVIEDHFDSQYELETTLRLRKQSGVLAALERDGLPAGSVSFTRQRKPLGLGHAVWCARNLVGDEPFAVLLPDMIIKAQPGGLSQLLECYRQCGGGNVIAVEEVPMEDVSRYGVVEPSHWSRNRFTISRMVEKPAIADAPSNLIISGRYILQPEIFEELERGVPSASGEIQITDAMVRLMARQPFHGLKFRGRTFDCGDKVGFLAANLAFALDRPEFGDSIRRMVEDVVLESGGTVVWEEEKQAVAG